MHPPFLLDQWAALEEAQEAQEEEEASLGWKRKSRLRRQINACAAR